MFLLAMGMMFMLLLANGNAQFGRSSLIQPPWPQPRQDVPGWGALHLSYIDKIAQASAGQVGSLIGPSHTVRFQHPLHILAIYERKHSFPRFDSICGGLQGLDILMYGDTLVEAWRGTFLGEPSIRAQGCSDIFHNHFGLKYRAAALGIAGGLCCSSSHRTHLQSTAGEVRNCTVSYVCVCGAGDTTANLMWRLQNGEMVPGLRAGVVVLHIGASDLTYASFQVASLFFLC